MPLEVLLRAREPRPLGAPRRETRGSPRDRRGSAIIGRNVAHPQHRAARARADARRGAGDATLRRDVTASRLAARRRRRRTRGGAAARASTRQNSHSRRRRRRLVVDVRRERVARRGRQRAQADLAVVEERPARHRERDLGEPSVGSHARWQRAVVERAFLAARAVLSLARATRSGRDRAPRWRCAAPADVADGRRHAARARPSDARRSRARALVTAAPRTPITKPS